MKNIKINDKTIIYVLCPAYVKTGGPELLHQLVKCLNDKNNKAYIAYYNTNNENKNYRNSDFEKYASKYVEINDIEDNENNVLIMPESVYAIKLSKKFKRIQKGIWWLSVDNFLSGYRLIRPLKVSGIVAYTKLLIKRRIIFNFNYIKKMSFHLCQSYYAVIFLKNKKINNIEYLSDYINDTYLNIEDEKKVNKEDIVLYNPKKGFKFTKKIIKQASELKWLPIQNLTTEQVRELLLKSKVYIDFGNHPGKDRFPRESAMCGCCVITGKKGSAKFYEDVPIENEFKFEDKTSNITEIIKKIEMCLDDYNNQTKKFEYYRNYIKTEKLKFEEDVGNIFKLGEEK